MENTDKNFQDEEIWKEIQGFEGEYAVSSMGRVKNLKNGKIFTGVNNGNGYKIITLKGKTYMVHRLVALAFIPNPDNLPYINHIDEKKDNNDVSNLEWCTASYNTNYSSHKQSCKINQITKDSELVKTWESSMQINRETGYDASSIIKCCRGKRKQAYGYRWEYADPSQQHKFNQPVAALTKDDEFVAEYRSAAEASRCLKISYTQVYLCLNGTYKSTHGLKFIYID